VAACLLAVWHAAAASADEHSFVVGVDSALYYQGPLTPNGSLGGQVAGEPAMTSDGRFVAVRGTDNLVYYQEWSRGAWSGWIGLGGTTAYPPAVAENGDELYVVARGTDGLMYFRYRQAGQWVGDWRLGGGFLSEAPVAQTFNGVVHLLGRSPLGRLLHGTLSGGQFSGWTDLFGILSSPPRVDANPTALYVVFNGSNSSAWLRRLTPDGTWSAEIPLGGQILGSPDVVARQGAVTVFARGADNTIYYQQERADGQWLRVWHWLAGGTLDSPQAAQEGQKAFVYVLGGGVVWRTSVPSNVWPGWEAIDKGAITFNAQPAISAARDGE
jgi:hypothetical protein